MYSFRYPSNLITEPVARTMYSLPLIATAFMSTPVLSTIASVIWLAIVRFQIIVYRRSCSDDRYRATFSGVFSIDVGRTAS